jgi:hypothetical protein
MIYTSYIGKPFGNTLWREAAKIDKILKEWEGTREDRKTPELEEALFALEQIVAANPQVDGILPAIWKWLKKGDVTVDAEGNVTPVIKPETVYNEETGETTEVPPDPRQEQPQPMPIIHVADWFGDKNSPTRKGVDINQLTPSDVTDRVSQWDEELAAKREQDAQQEENQNQGVLRTFEDGSYLRQVQTPEESIELGRNTGNCLKDSRSYFDNSAIIEYVNSDGRQEVAIEIGPRPGAEKLPNGLNDPKGGIIKQVQARRGEAADGGYSGNKLPTEEVQRKLRDFFQSVKVEDRPMVQGQQARKITEPSDFGEFQSWLDAGKEQEYRIHDMGEDFVLPDAEWQEVYDRNPRDAQTGYIGKGHNGIPSEVASALFQLPVSGGEVTRGDNPPQWNKFVKSLATDSAKNPMEATQRLEQVYEALTSEGQMERFQEAVHEELPHLEEAFYRNLYMRPPSGIEEGHEEWDKYAPQTQFKNWPLVRGFGNGLEISRGTEGQPIQPLPNWREGISPDQMAFPGLEPEQNLHPMYASRKEAIAPIYYRWNFNPKTGVALSHNEGDLDAFVNYREGSETDSTNGYAYRIGNGWRLTDWEHRPVEDPYVVSQVVRKLQDRGVPKKQARRKPSRTRVPLWSELP